MFGTKFFGIYLYKIFACITTTYTGYSVLCSLKKYEKKKPHFQAVLFFFFVVVGKGNGVFLVTHNGWVGRE